MPFISVSAYEAVPANTALIVEWKNGDALATKLDSLSFLDNSTQLKIVSKLNADFAVLEQLFEEAVLNQQLLNEARVVAAMQASRSSEVNFTILLDDYKMSFDLEDFLSQLENYTVLPFNFKQHTIYSIKDKNGAIASMASYRGLLIFAKYAYMVEDAISQLASLSTNLCNRSDFRKVKQSDRADNTVTVYCNFENFPPLYSSFLRTEKWHSAKTLSNLGSWYRFTLSFADKEIKLQGKGALAAENSFYKTLGKSKAINDPDIAAILPNHLSQMIRLGLTDFKNFGQNTDQASEDFQQYFLPWIKQTVAHIITEPYSGNLEEEQFALFKANNIDTALHFLNSLMEVKGATEDYEYNSFRIQQILLDNVLEPIFGKAINPIQNPYMVLLNDYVLLGNSKQALEIWVDKFIAGQTLDKEPSYLQYQATKPTQAQRIELFVNPKNLAPIVKNWVKPAFKKAIYQDFDLLSTIEQINWQADPSNGTLNFDAQVKYHEEVQSQTSIVWKAHLSNELRLAPSVLTNPQTQEKEIFVQDVANYIYLLNNEGKMLWKRLLKEPIISAIHQIDYYKNGQGQFLFNTKNKIYLLDRAGQDVSSFPLRLQSEITNGVCVIETERLDGYNFFVACRNRNIYGFDRSGNPIPGWNPKTGVGKLNFPLVHFYDDEKDFILALNEQGKLHAFKRNGTNRFSSKSFATKFLSPPDYQLLGDTKRIVLANTKGKVQVVNLSGGSFSLNANSGTKEVSQFLFADVLGDARKDYITMGEQQLELFYYDGKTFKQGFRYDYQNPQDEIFAVNLNGQEQAYIGSLSKQKKQINLVDAAAKLYPGFPLAGTSKFTVTDLFNNNRNILVVANANSIYTYKLP